MKKNIYLPILLFLVSAGFIFLIPTTSAQQNPTIDFGSNNGNDFESRPDGFLKNPLSVGDSIPALLSSILNDIVIPLGAALCVFTFIFAGFQYVTAQGNETKITKANKALLYASIGTVVLLGSWVIAKALCETIHQLGGPACPTNI